MKNIDFGVSVWIPIPASATRASGPLFLRFGVLIYRSGLECSLTHGLAVVLTDRPYWKAPGMVVTAPRGSKGSNEWKLPLLLGMFMAVVVRNK